jgi:hypothetical protein
MTFLITSRVVVAVLIALWLASYFLLDSEGSRPSR